jgi:general secretion pathway protein G
MNKKYQIRHPQNGLTLVELMVALAILGIVSSIGVSLYKDYTMGANVNRAITEIRMIDLMIKDYRLTTRQYPPSLPAIGIDYQDPWGNDYQYLDITAENGVGNLRKDHNLVPINTDFDLYSMGPDGSTVPPLTAVSSHDDIIRANNGRYVGVADGY